MKLRVKVSLVFAVLTSFATACRAPDHTAQVVRDLQVLKSRVEQRNPRYQLADLPLLDGISQESLNFISQRFEAEEVSAFWKSHTSLARIFGIDATKEQRTASLVDSFSPVLKNFYSHLAGGALELSIEDARAISPAQIDSQSRTRSLSANYQALAKQHLAIFGDDKWADRAYCEDECLCTSKKMQGELLKNPGFRLPLVFVRVTPLTGSLLIREWTYHFALLIGDGKGNWSVVDHRLYNDSELHTLADWTNTLSPAAGTQFTFQNDVQNFDRAR